MNIPGVGFDCAAEVTESHLRVGDADDEWAANGFPIQRAQQLMLGPILPLALSKNE